MCSDVKIKKLQFQNELMQRIVLKNEKTQNEVIRMKQELEIMRRENVTYIKDLEKKTELLKQYKVKVSISFVIH